MNAEAREQVDGDLAPCENALRSEVTRDSLPFATERLPIDDVERAARHAARRAARLQREGRSRRLREGTCLGGRYVAQAVLGAGGTCEVSRAYDSRLKRHVALKILRSVGLSEPVAATARERVLREAGALVRAQHAHVVPLLDVGEHEGDVYLILELCAGGNLRSKLAAALALPLQDRIGWLLQIGSGLAHAHAHGVLHRDVKPENIVLTHDGVAKLADFGIAKCLLAASSPLTVGVVGTPRYMAPEQLAGEPLDARADQFSWALVAVELLTGSSLLPGDARALTALEGRGVSTDVGRVLARCLEEKREARYPDMASVVTALEGLAPASRVRAVATDALASRVPVPSSPSLAYSCRALVARWLLAMARTLVAGPRHARPDPRD